MRDIIIGCDNAAVQLKHTIIAYLEQLGIRVKDLGCDGEDDHTYYPTIAERVCRQITQGGFEQRGILICGTGIGMCITANKFPGIRAAVCHDSYSAERSILSNNGNVLCMGARIIGPELAKKIVGEWMGLEFKDGSSTAKVADMLRVEQTHIKA